jgi:cobalamin-dependent methionine synthase I
VKFNGTYTNAPMSEGKAELGKPLTENCIEMATEYIDTPIFMEDEFGTHDPKIKKSFIDIIESRKKAKFFRRLNKVLDNKLVKPSIIIEYVNQYQRGDK